MFYGKPKSARLNAEDHGYVTWDSGDFHYFADVANDGPITFQYVFVLDALNFCFWPTPEYVTFYSVRLLFGNSS